MYVYEVYISIAYHFISLLNLADYSGERNYSDWIFRHLELKEMPRLQWRKYRTSGFVTTILILLVTIRSQTYQHEESLFLANVHPNEPWEFVADFSNMKYLNPTMIDFNILSESGNYSHWKYSTEYSENLSHWPYLFNNAVAHFEVKISPKKDSYFIYSIHRTCVFLGLYCLNSESEFKFGHGNSSKGTVCQETIKYQCPALLSFFCSREVVFQRKAIMDNLYKRFTVNL